MPLLRPPAQRLVNDARFTIADFVDLQNAIRSRSATLQDAITIATRYVDTLEPGVGSKLRSLLRSLGSSTLVESPIANLSSEGGLLNGDVILPQSGRRHASVRPVQRALMALASRNRDTRLMLPTYGADSDYGNETTEAVKAFQRNSRLPVTGTVDVMTAKALDRALQNTSPPGILSATPKDLAIAATELCQGELALHYGVVRPWINLDPYHAVPVNRPFDFLAGRWKCNLYGGNVLRKGGYEPPYYGNRGSGEYPNANQWYKWSDKYAARNGNKVHFTLIAEVPVLSIQNESEARQAIANLLSKAQLGDFLMQDHPGGQVADGGHTRVTVENRFFTDGTVGFAQAQYERSEIQYEGVEDFWGSENIWLLRPTVKM